jgi:hypothetical protein
MSTSELDWHRDWRNRLLNELRNWWKPASYAEACRSWSRIERILKETPPNHIQTIGADR